ncbi:serine/threonine kinase [Aureococcus anophagefferens]|nr:serine/threonine kinase [Aureococcus anophagefferens]
MTDETETDTSNFAKMRTTSRAKFYDSFLPSGTGSGAKKSYIARALMYALETRLEGTAQVYVDLLIQAKGDISSKGIFLSLIGGYKAGDASDVRRDLAALSANANGGLRATQLRLKVLANQHRVATGMQRARGLARSTPSTRSIAIGLLGSLISYRVFSHYEPYVEEDDGVVSEVAQTELVLVFFYALMVFATDNLEQHDGVFSGKVFASLLVVLLASTLLIAVWPIILANFSGDELRSCVAGLRRRVRRAEDANDDGGAATVDAEAVKRADVAQDAAGPRTRLAMPYPRAVAPAPQLPRARALPRRTGARVAEACSKMASSRDCRTRQPRLIDRSAPAAESTR